MAIDKSSMFRCFGGSKDKPNDPEVDEYKETIAKLSAELKASQVIIEYLQNIPNVQKTVSQKDDPMTEFHAALRKRKEELRKAELDRYIV